MSKPLFVIEVLKSFISFSNQIRTMKIFCSVEVLNRSLPALNMASKKAKKSVLTIGKSSEDDHFIFHQSNENMRGNKYKIKNNIKNVFVKFVNEGKATIRFEEPNHDLAIKSDPVQLKAFLKTLKLCLAGIPSAQLSSIHSIQLNNKALKPVKTKLKILSQEEYPVLDGFPRTLQQLTINGAKVKKLDSRILRLRSLEVLNLENNMLTTLPEMLGTSLPNLTELYLANNILGKSRDWRWIVNSKLSKQLKLLDLSSNKIDVLPDKIVTLGNLVTLKLNNNALESLPQGMGCLKKLRYFSVNNNFISYLPRSFVSLQLDSIDISRNNFCKKVIQKLTPQDFQQVPSLLDVAASCVIKKRLPYSAETIPSTLVDHLENAPFCICGNPSFSSQPESYVHYKNFMNSAVDLTFSQNTTIPVSVKFCSFRCYYNQI